MKNIYAHIQGIGIHFPNRILGNDELALAFPDWSAQKILDKTGIFERRIAAESETAGDLACHAAKNLFEQKNVSATDVDFIILCTQAPDHVLPLSLIHISEPTRPY